jgi:hypothetical protein
MRKALQQLTQDQYLEGCLKVKDAAVMCGISTREFYRLLDARQITYAQIGAKARRPYRASIIVWLKANTVLARTV